MEAIFLQFTELWDSGPRFAQTEHFKLGTDSILLADFIGASPAKHGIDLGCGSGVIALLLMEKNKKLHMTGLEILPEAAAVARANMQENGFEQRSQIIEGDIRQYKKLFPGGGFDLVAANPPYFPANSGAVSPKEGRAAARGELQCSMEDLCSAAAYLLCTGGRFGLVHRPERLSQLFCQLSGKGMEPKRLRFVCHRAENAPSLVLVEARRGAKPGLKIEAPLILSCADGTESKEYRRIYHR